MRRSDDRLIFTMEIPIHGKTVFIWRRDHADPVMTLVGSCICMWPLHEGISPRKPILHYDDVIMTMLASQITSLMVVYSIVYSGVNQRKHQSSASLAFVREIHRDRWISRTNGQLRGKCFHLMTSSCTSLAPRRCGNNFENINFVLIIQNSKLDTCYEISLMWMPQNLTNEKSTLFQAMAWCHQATWHYMIQC